MLGNYLIFPDGRPDRDYNTTQTNWGLVLCFGKCNYICMMYSTSANMTCYRLSLKTTKSLPGNHCEIPAANLGGSCGNYTLILGTG